MKKATKLRQIQKAAILFGCVAFTVDGRTMYRHQSTSPDDHAKHFSSYLGFLKAIGVDWRTVQHLPDGYLFCGRPNRVYHPPVFT